MSKLLVTLLAALTIIAVPLSGGAAAKTTDIYQLAHQYVQVTPDGLFAIKGDALSRSDNARLHAVFDSLNAHLASVDRRLRPSLVPALAPATQSHSATTTGGKMAAPLASWCGYIPRWAFEAYAWGVIIAGGVTATLALFASGTIFGLPAGAVLGAAGIWIGMDGSAMLWFVDTYMPPWGVYVCVF